MSKKTDLFNLLNQLNNELFVTWETGINLRTLSIWKKNLDKPLSAKAQKQLDAAVDVLRERVEMQKAGTLSNYCASQF